MKLDAVDRRILEAPPGDAEVHMSVSAERIGLTQTPSWRRVQRLRQSGVITFNPRTDLAP